MSASVSGNSFQFKNVLHDVGGSLYRGIVLGPRSSARSIKAFEVPLVPLLPLALAISSLVYQQGVEAIKPGGDPKAWQKLLLQTGIGSLLLEHTKNVFPLWGLGISAYHAGRAPNMMEKLHSLVTTVLTLGFGYSGYHLTKGFSLEAQQGENREILELLGDARLKPWIAGLKKNYSVPGAYNLAQRLESLEKMLREEQRLVTVDKLNPLDEQLKTMRQQLQDLKLDVLEHIQAVETGMKGGRIIAAEKFLPQSKPARLLYEGLREALHDSTSAAGRITRLLNPAAGFILGGLLLGGMAAKSINLWLDQRYPHLKRQRPTDIFYNHATLLPSHNRHPVSYQPPAGVQNSPADTYAASLYGPQIGRPGYYRPTPQQHAHGMPSS
ncbi:MAG TPA: hypothetical protein V6C52_08990 [Coleofasciculaceae cyanobacterium]